MPRLSIMTYYLKVGKKKILLITFKESKTTKGNMV